MRKPGHTGWPLKQLMDLEEQEMDLAPDVATEGNCGHLSQEGKQLEREEGIKAQRGHGESLQTQAGSHPAEGMTLAM